MEALSAVISNRKGVSILAAIFIIVILGFMGMIFVSMIGSGSLTSVNNLQTTQALYVAEGGMEFVLRNGTFPNYTYPLTSLGSGSFTTTSQYIGPGGIAPATVTDNPLSAVATTVNATSTANYVIPGTVRIGSENLHCTGVSINQFTGCVRGFAGSTSAVHASGSTITQCSVTSEGTVGSARRSVRASIGTGGAAGEAVINGRFPAGSLGSWPDSNCPPNKGDGTVAIDMAASATADATGSLRIRTNAGKKENMNDCRVQTLSAPLAPSTPVTLSLRYQFASTHPCSASSSNATAKCMITVEFLYASGLTQTIWTNSVYPSAWTSSGVLAWTTSAASTLTDIRIVYDIESANVNGAQATGWIDEESLVASGGGASVLSWQEVVN